MKRISLLFCALFFTALSFAQQKTVDSWTDGKFITVNGAKLWVVTVGQGDPVIFIAGGPGGAHPSRIKKF
ncbi:alpha/beta fold hydrolase [Pedobacter sp. NJ-S-72]